jgi:hypothetical protein
MRKKKKAPNLRRHRQQTQIRLIAGGLLILLIVGGGLVWLIYGLSAALTVGACLLGATAIMGLLWGILKVLEFWVQEDEP